MTRRPFPAPRGIFVVAGAVAMTAAIAGLAPSGDFFLTFLYVACTFSVCALTTWTTIRVLAQFARDRSGVVEIGLLVGLFGVSPLALSGALILLEAVAGAL